MEVIVSLLPLVANSKTHKVVLILSSSVPVNWAIVARGVRGHISVHVRIPSFFAFLHTGLKNEIHSCYLIHMSNNNLLLLSKATARLRSIPTHTLTHPLTYYSAAVTNTASTYKSAAKRSPQQIQKVYIFNFSYIFSRNKWCHDKNNEKCSS